MKIIQFKQMVDGSYPSVLENQIFDICILQATVQLDS